jgi:hypothetical protein
VLHRRLKVYLQVLHDDVARGGDGIRVPSAEIELWGVRHIPATHAEHSARFTDQEFDKSNCLVPKQASRPA